MIIGIGTDIFHIARMQPLASSLDDAFFRKAFTENERRQASTRPDPLLFFSTRFAGKEAVYKAISQSGCDFRPQEIEIIDTNSGKPEVTLWGETRKALEKYPLLRIWVSLSSDGEYVSAYSLAETGEGE